MSLEAFYTFNENSITDIQDYSTNNNIPTATNLTVQASSLLGYELVFNSTTDKLAINLGGGNIAAGAVEIIVKLEATTGVKTIFFNGAILITWDGTNLAITGYDEFGNNTTTSSQVLSTGVYYTIGITTAGTYDVYINGVFNGTLGLIFGFTGSYWYLGLQTFGDTGASDSANFTLKEVKIYSNVLTAANFAAIYNSPNGITVTNSVQHNYMLGDLIGNLDTLQYAVVTYIVNATQFKLQPLNTGFDTGQVMQKLGHIWDADNDHFLYLTEDGIYYYDSINTVAEVLNSANLVWSLDEGGGKKSYTTKTANYTATNSDSIIFCDTSSGSFTITLPATPTDKKEIIIKDDAQTFNSQPLTINPNGNSLEGSTNSMLINAKKASYTFFYKGTGSNQEWKII